MKTETLYTIGILQAVESPTVDDVLRGLRRAFEEAGLQDGVNVRLQYANARGDTAELLTLSQAFVEQRASLIIPLSTPCLQAALIAAPGVPVVFASVANPYLAGAGKSADNHLAHVTGVSSLGPIRQTIELIREVMPRARRIGTLWTPAELNSAYYLEVARESAAELGAEIVAVPVSGADEVLPSARLLLSQKVDVIYQISDNTINSTFALVGQAAEEGGVPLFGGFLRSVELGACAAMGFDFAELGYRAGRLAVRIKNGESPSRIPFESMAEFTLWVNVEAARRQGVDIPPRILRRAEIVPAARSTG
ncbi:MAG: ABC transporter substrate-binding protein [Candidatus Aminicenantes bacterium]|nr:ABC transporter substrate-binding protein [Candidatus Aminicenantes bacterium]